MRKVLVLFSFVILTQLSRSVASSSVDNPVSNDWTRRADMGLDEALGEILGYLGDAICVGYEEYQACIEFQLCGDSGSSGDDLIWKVLVKSGMVYDGKFDMNTNKYCFGTDLDLVLAVDLTPTGDDVCLQSVKVTSRWQDKFEVLTNGKVWLSDETDSDVALTNLRAPCFTARTCATHTYSGAETSNTVRVTAQYSGSETCTKNFQAAKGFRYQTVCFPAAHKIGSLAFDLQGSDNWCVDDLLMAGDSNKIVKLVSQKAVWVEDQKSFEILGPGTNKLCYDDFPELDGALCYPRCNDNYVGVGPVCWQNCPPSTTDAGAVCIKNTYTRGVGTIPQRCSGDKDAGLCYEPCRSGYTGVGPVCWEVCPSNYINTGAFCQRNAHIYGADNSACPWYDVCGLTFSRGCSKCDSSYHNDGCTCRRDVHIYAKNTYGRGVGKVPSCTSDQDSDAGLCYTPCGEGYYGVGPVCWATCQEGLLDTGTQCQKDSYGRGVGKPINCLKLPLLKPSDFMGPYRTIYESIKLIDQIAQGTESLEDALCQTLYNTVSPVMRAYDTIAGCIPGDGWNTMFASFSVTGSAFASASLGVSVNRDFHTGVVRCEISICLGLSSAIEVGFGASIGFRNGLPTPGAVSSSSFGIELFGNGFSMEFENTVPATSIQAVSFGISVGFDATGAPLSIGQAVCYTAPCAYTDLDNPSY